MHPTNAISVGADVDGVIVIAPAPVLYSKVVEVVEIENDTKLFAPSWLPSLPRPSAPPEPSAPPLP